MRAVLVFLVAATACRSPGASSESVSAFALPARSFFVSDLLGKGRVDVDRLLGPSTTTVEGRAAYGGFPGVAVTVLFDNDRAALVSVSPEHFAASRANVDCVLAWLRADRDKVAIEEPSDASVDVWSPALHARQLQRSDAAHTLGGTARGVILEVPAPCDADRLHSIASAESSQRLGKLGFAGLACASGARLPLR